MNKEWENETDYLEFEYKGYECCISRMSLGHLCGYVFIPKGHKYYVEDTDNFSALYFNDIYEDITIHGGLTFGRYGKNSNGEFGIALGFDCGHLEDIIPCIFSGEENPISDLIISFNDIILKLYKDSDITATYKNIDFVTNELKSLVDQLDK